MIILNIHNDGKEKYQSFEAYIEGVDCERGYGASEDEAIKEYKKALGRYETRVAVALQDLTLGNIEISKVDCLGKVI